jgi:uncharacterized membrane protein
MQVLAPGEGDARPLAHRGRRRKAVPGVTYEETITNVVKVVEAVGAAIMIFGGLGAFAVFALRARRADTIRGSYPALRRDLGRCILLGLEVLIVADIVRTIIVDATIVSVAVLATVVVIRILLSFALEVEIGGTWPWQRGGPLE